MMREVEYDIYCDSNWVAGTNDLDEAMRYAHQYCEDGKVEVYRVEKSITLQALLSHQNRGEK